MNCPRTHWGAFLPTLSAFVPSVGLGGSPHSSALPQEHLHNCCRLATSLPAQGVGMCWLQWRLGGGSETQKSFT